MTGEEPNKLMERWEKETKTDEWKRIEEAYNRLTSDPENPFFLLAETLRQISLNEKERGCFKRWTICIAMNLGVPIEGAPFTGGIADVMIAGGKAGEAYFKAKAYEEARKHALKTGRWMFWRFKVYKRYMNWSKALGKLSLYVGVGYPFVKCIVELVDCYTEFLPEETFEKSLFFWTVHTFCK